MQRDIIFLNGRKYITINEIVQERNSIFKNTQLIYCIIAYYYAFVKQSHLEPQEHWDTVTTKKLNYKC